MNRRIRHKLGFEVLREAIPDHHEEIAALLGVGWREIYRWQEPPESNDQPTANGRRSPLDRLLDLLSAIYLHNPEGAALVVEAVVARLDKLRHTHRRPDWNAHETIADVLTGATCVVTELIDGEVTDSDLKALRKLKHVVDEALEHARAVYQTEGRERR